MAHLVKSVDFERVLRMRSRAATPHFAVHHLPASIEGPVGAVSEPVSAELSTTHWTTGVRPVEDLPSSAPMTMLAVPCQIGVVVPKRHARRSVTRSLIKRQIYAAAERHRDGLATGLWVVRLRAPFAHADFASAASATLKLCARAELETLFGAATAEPAR